MKKIIALTLVLFSSTAMAQGYECTTSRQNEGLWFCGPEGTAATMTRTFISQREEYVFTDEDGIQRIGERPMFYTAECGKLACRVVGDNEVAGESPIEGRYVVRWGHYINVSETGKPAIYEGGTGPAVGEPRIPGTPFVEQTDEEALAEVKTCVAKNVAKWRKFIGINRQTDRPYEVTAEVMTAWNKGCGGDGLVGLKGHTEVNACFNNKYNEATKDLGAGSTIQDDAIELWSNECTLGDTSDSDPIEADTSLSVDDCLAEMIADAGDEPISRPIIDEWRDMCAGEI
jgi:hypothetical protein